MSSKRKNTKPIRVSDIFLQCNSNSSSQSGLSAVPPLSNVEFPSSDEQGCTEAEQASSWQVTLSLPNKPQDLPTMVSPYITSNSKWLSSSYGGKSSNDNPFDVLRGSPLTNGEHNDPLMSDFSNSRPFPKKTRKIRYKYHENSQVKYKCDVCHYCTNRSDHYKRHLITHSEEKPLKCLTCGYRSGRSDHFKRHLGRHGLSKEEIRKQCEYNGIRSSPHHNARNLGPLLQGENDAVMFQVKCSTNDSSPASANASSSQATPKKFSCDVCGYTTDRNSHFTRHVRTHSEDRPYNCEGCGKQFKLDTYLKKHRCSVKSKATSSSQVDSRSDQPSDHPSIVPVYGSMATDNDLEDGGSELTCTTCGVIFRQQSDLATHTCHNLMETL